MRPSLPVLAVLFDLCSCQRQDTVLRLLVWEGYADPALVRAFEDEHRVKIVPAYMSPSDQLLASLSDEGADIDIISPSSDSVE